MEFNMEQPQPDFQQNLDQLAAAQQQMLNNTQQVLNNTQQAAAAANAAAQAVHQQNQQPNNPYKGIKLQPPKPYTGKQFEDLTNFLNDLEAYIGFHVPILQQDQHPVLIIAASYLRDNAKIWWNSQRAQIHDWPTFTQQIRQQFEPVNKVQLYRDKLAQVSQTGSVTAYNSLFRDLSIKIGYNNISQSELLDRYIRGLKPFIKLQVLIRQPGDLSTAMQVAQQCDAIRQQARGQSKSEYSWKNNTSSDTSAPMDISVMSTSNKSGTYRRPNQSNKSPPRKAPPPRKTLSKEEFARRRQEKACYNCGKSGHLARDCKNLN